MSDEGAIILEVKMPASLARFEVQQCWNIFVTRNHLENILVDTINYRILITILTFSYLCIILKSIFCFAHNPIISFANLMNFACR